MKKLIINADDFGLSEGNNIAIKNGYQKGIVTSTSIISNLEGFNHAINEIYPQIKGIDIGFHFNIKEGKSLTNSNLLCNSEGYFNNNYIQLIEKSYNKKFINQVENEFHKQIEKVLNNCDCKITHIDSHVHTHAIPNIFKLIVKLAKEYNIEYIRTQNEIPYIVFNKSLKKYPINMLKNMLLNNFSQTNKKILRENNIKTNDYLIGVLYTGNMSYDSIIEGLKQIKKDNSITEILFHPYYEKEIKKDKKSNYNEYIDIIENKNIQNAITSLDFQLCNYKKLINP